MAENRKKPGSAGRGRAGKLILVFVVGAIVVSAVLMALAAAVFCAILYIPTISFNSGYTMKLGNSGENVRKMTEYKISYGAGVHGDQEYMDFTRLADKCGFPVSGDVHSLKYRIYSSDGESGTLIADIDNSRLLVNGKSIPVSNGIYFTGGRLYLPYDVVTDCLTGLRVENDGHAYIVLIDGEVLLRYCDDKGCDTIGVSEDTE